MTIHPPQSSDRSEMIIRDDMGLPRGNYGIQIPATGTIFLPPERILILSLATRTAFLAFYDLHRAIPGINLNLMGLRQTYRFRRNECWSFPVLYGFCNLRSAVELLQALSSIGFTGASVNRIPQS